MKKVSEEQPQDTFSLFLRRMSTVIIRMLTRYEKSPDSPSSFGEEQSKPLAGVSMSEKKNVFLRLWNWLGHVSRALWVYKLVLPLGIAALTFIKGHATGYPLAFLIPLTVVAAGATLYCVNQIAILYNQFREGFAYGLAYEGVFLGFNPTRDEAILQLGVLIRNVTANPMRYRAERFDVVIRDRTIPTPIEHQGNLIPRGSQRQYMAPSFTREQVGQFIDQNVDATITLEFHYGHPDGPYVRRLKMKMSVALKLSNPIGSRDVIVSESDEEI
jgi:hypothetical protein